MKKKIFAIMMALFLAAPVAMMAQRDINEEKSKEKVQLRKEVDKKPSKTAKNAARNMTKEGWKIKPGALPLDKQMDKIYTMKENNYEDGSELYIFGSGNGVGKTYEAAKQQALIIARQDIAAQIGVDITTIIDAEVANNQLSPTEAESVTQAYEKGKSRIEKSLGNTVNVVECHRENKNATIEVQVQVAYSKSQALKMAKSIMRQELGNEGSLVDKME